MADELAGTVAAWGARRLAMTSIEHEGAAVYALRGQGGEDAAWAAVFAAQAQVHATLAMAAATREQTDVSRRTLALLHAVHLPCVVPAADSEEQEEDVG